MIDEQQSGKVAVSWADDSGTPALSALGSAEVAL